MEQNAASLRVYLAVDRLLKPETQERYGLVVNDDGSISIPCADRVKVYRPEGQPKIRWAQVYEDPIVPPFPDWDTIRNARLWVEGEFDAMLASQELGIPVASTTLGANGWKSDWTDAMTGMTVTLLYDADESGDKGAKMAAEQLRKGGVRVKIARWPADKPKGYDITEHFQSGGTVDEFKAVLNAAQEYQLPGLAMSAADFIRQNLPAQKWLIQQVWPEEAIGFVGGAPKSFKSFLTLECAMSIATGGNFLGEFKAPEPRRVLLVQQESARVAFQQRMRLASQRYGMPHELYVLTNHSFDLGNEEQVEKLEAEIERLRPALTILDPLSSFVSGDENNSQEMGALVRLLRRWRDTYATGICIVHHTTKTTSNNKKAGDVTTVRGGDRMRGSGQFYAAAEVGLWVQRTEDESALSSRVRVELKESEAPPPFVMFLDPRTTALSVAGGSGSVEPAQPYWQQDEALATGGGGWEQESWPTPI